MRVLLLGATGNVGSRLLPSLVAHGHQVIVYVRTPSKLPNDATAIATAVVKGDALDSNAIKTAILEHKCDAVINTAGLAAIFSKDCDLPAIFQAVVKAAIAAHEQRGGAPLRAWFLSGQGLLDSQNPGYTLLDYIRVFPVHSDNYTYIKSIPADKLQWSLFCPSYMPPAGDKINYSPTPGAAAAQLVASVDSPPAWHKTLLWVPLAGYWLNIFTQMLSYTTPLENCTDFIAGDLAAGSSSPYLLKRVGVKMKPKGA